MNNNEPKGLSKWLEAGLFVAGCQLVGFVGSYVGGAFKKQDWYDNTAKPRIWPPQWFFPLVWVANYTFMGLATWQVWRQRQQKSVDGPLGWFGVHLFHNFTFIPLVYAVKRRWFYTLNDSLGVLLAAITTQRYSKVSRPALLLMLPYLAWLCFTTSIKFLWWRMEKR